MCYVWQALPFLCEDTLTMDELSMDAYDGT